MYKMVDDEHTALTTGMVLDWMKENGPSYRKAAAYFGTSASTLCRFMRRNGYVVQVALPSKKRGKA